MTRETLKPDATVQAAPQSASAGRPPDESWSVIVEPARGWVPLRLADLWHFRELLYFLTWRDVKVRYKQTVLGAGWAIIQPFTIMVIFTIVFGHFAHVPSEGAPYAIFSYAGLLPWTFFAFAMGQSANSLVSSANLVSKVYFPRLIIPLASALPGLLDLAIALVVLSGMMVFYGVHPTPALLALPLFVALALLASLAAGIWLCALNVHYRDVRYTIPFLTQIWLFATPVAYPASLIHGPLHTVIELNPMAGAVEGFRWAILGHSALDAGTTLISVGITVAVLISGTYYFRRVERQFADVI